MTKWEDKQLELEVEKKVTDYAKRLGWIVRKVVFQGRRGAPDRWFFGPGGRLVIIEFKAPGGVISYHQSKIMKKLKELDFEVHVVDEIAAGKRIFDAA